MGDKKGLTPGSTARIYRDGGVLEDQLLVPAEGRFEVRHLPPGQYVARDETGGEQAFEVKAKQEVTVVSGSGEPSGPTGAPGAGHTQEIPFREVGAQEIDNEFEPEHSPAPRRRRGLTPEDAADDRDDAPAAPGTALVEPIEDRGAQPINEREWRAGRPDSEEVERVEQEERERLEREHDDDEVPLPANLDEHPPGDPDHEPTEDDDDDPDKPDEADVDDAEERDRFRADQQDESRERDQYDELEGDDLHRAASEAGIRGRSKMSADELRGALRDHNRAPGLDDEDGDGE